MSAGTDEPAARLGLQRERCVHRIVKAWCATCSPVVAELVEQPEPAAPAAPVQTPRRTAQACAVAVPGRLPRRPTGEKLCRLCGADGGPWCDGCWTPAAQYLQEGAQRLGHNITAGMVERYLKRRQSVAKQQASAARRRGVTS